MSDGNHPGRVLPRVRPRRLTKAERSEIFVLVLIMLAVGLAAGAGSFKHVHDWTMNNSPADTGDWFGWTNAVISELVPVASLLVMRRRRRAGQPVVYPMFLLGTALVISVTAQLAVAKPGLAGGVVAVIPALAFAGLAKLIFGKPPKIENPTNEKQQYQPAPTTRRPPAQTPVPNQQPANNPNEDRPHVIESQDDQMTTPNPSPATISATESASNGAAPLPAQLLQRARHAANDHLTRHGRTITRDELRAVLRISNATAGEVMRALGLTDSSRTNGTANNATSPLTGKPLLPTS